MKVDYTTDNGSSWMQIAKAANTGHMTGLFPNTLNSMQDKVTGYNGTYELCQDESDAKFTIAKTDNNC